MKTKIYSTFILLSLILSIFSLKAFAFKNQQDFDQRYSKFMGAEMNRFRKDKAAGKWKLIPQYYDSFWAQPKYDKFANYIFEMKQSNQRKTINLAMENKNYYFAVYLLHRMADSIYKTLMNSKQGYKGMDEKSYNILKKLNSYKGIMSQLLLAAHIKKLSNLFLFQLMKVNSDYYTNLIDLWKKNKIDFKYVLNDRNLFYIFNYTLPYPDKEFKKKGFFPEYSSDYILKSFFYYNTLNRAGNFPKKNKLAYNILKKTIGALGKLRSNKNIVTFSGLSAPKNLDDKIKVGDTLCYTGFLSTSLAKGVAEHYRSKSGSRYLFKFNGKSGADIARFTMFPFEKEVLYYPYVAFKLDKIEKKGNIFTRNYIVHVTETKHKSKKCKGLTSGKIHRIPEDFSKYLNLNN